MVIDNEYNKLGLQYSLIEFWLFLRSIFKIDLEECSFVENFESILLPL